MDVLDAAAVRAWAVAARRALELARDRIDAVNVFPVADRDTGTNVLLTVTGGADALAAAPDAAGADEAARVLARGAMLAARGNSGVIVSQYLAGFARALVPAAGPADVARALVAAARAARESTGDPQEGTVLTLADAVGQGARVAVDAGAGLDAMLRQASADAHGSLAAISAAHPLLQAAHVVDAGACALLVVLDSLTAAVEGAEGDLDLDWLPAAGPRPAAAPDEGGAYEVMLLVSASGGEDLADALLAAMRRVGDSVAVVGTEAIWHVHVHTDDPEAAIEAAALGRREQVVVRLVDAPHLPGTWPVDPPERGSRWGVVACTPSAPLARWYAGAGAVALVACPEVPVRAGHVLRAVTDTGAASVAVLPGEVVSADQLGTLLDDEHAGPVVEVLGAADELAVAVAALALAGSEASAVRTRAAVEALSRLRVAEGADASAPAVVALIDVVRDVAPDAEAATVLHRDPLGAGVSAEVAAAAELRGLEVAFVGPTGRGPAVVVGLD
ncbi:DAK2 domain-containing protein [Cellulomonas alba]|uniref:DAK2 domain-containing protein n=1 Tax=Cellulomonas alba TaxID=3053467 RepID=A0ABT7SCP9_9CELL|nr:DAK2 domain-containing protein [Cellulomonas alba]MDM7853962.1 DAK2 domain-containing protein [Cellulomonas alba]